MVQTKITRTFKDLVKLEKWSPGKGEPGKMKHGKRETETERKRTPRKRTSLKKDPSPRKDLRVKSEVEQEQEEKRQVRTPTVLRTKVKRLESGVKVIDGGSTLGKSPRRKGRLEKGTVTTESGSGKISTIIQMLREKGLETTPSLPITRRQATVGNTSGLRAPQPAKEGVRTSKFPGTKGKEGREGSGKKGAKEKGTHTSFLRRWLTDSGGTITSGKQDDGGDSVARERERILEKKKEEGNENEKDWGR